MFTKIIFSIIFLLFNIVFAAEFPDKYRKCKAGDKECIINILNLMIEENFKMGLSDIHLPPFDPLPYQNMPMNTSGAAYRLDIILHDGYLEGLAKYRVNRIEGFGKDPSRGVFKYYGYAPKAYFCGNFTGDGQLVILPIHGKGYLQVNLTDVEMIGEVKTKVVRKNGEDYLKIKSLVTSGDAKAHFNFENLFRNKQIELEVNKVINDNSKEFLDNLRPSLMRGLSRLIFRTIQPVFEEVPYRKFFLDE